MEGALLYLQIDGQSEQASPPMEITFHFIMSSREDPTDWPSLTGLVQRLTLNSRSACPVLSIDFMKASPTALLSPKLRRMKATDATTFAQLSAKPSLTGNTKLFPYQPADLHALLRWNERYDTPSAAALVRKLGYQYAGLFRMLEKIGNAAYRLELSPHWRIHPVLATAQLEPSPSPSEDPLGRTWPTRSQDIYRNTERSYRKKMSSYELEKIMSRTGIPKDSGI